MRRFVTVMMLMAGAAWGQTATEALLSKLVHDAERYRGTLPSLVCEEHIVSQQVKKGKVKDEVDIEGTFRVTRTGPPEEPFEEAHEYRTVNGKPAPKHFGVPFFLSGAFANGIGFAPDRLGCYSYTEETGPAGQRVMVSTQKAGTENMLAECRSTPPGTVRKTFFDEAGGHVVRVEMRTPADVANRMKRPFYAEIEYGPIALGGATLWLPVRVATHDEKDERRFEVRYTDFHRYGGGMTILPGAEKVPDAAEASPGK